jgi:hypothetical protein
MLNQSRTTLRWLAGIALCLLTGLACSKGGDTGSTTPPPASSCAQGVAGPKYQAVKALISSNCALSGCHAGTQAPNFTDDCNIINNRLLIKARAVDGIPSFMPPTGPLPISERNKITDWINAGGRYTD